MRAILYLLTAAFFWGLNFHLAKVMLQSAAFLEAGFWRYLFGAGVLLLFTYRDLPSLQTLKTHKKGLFLVGVVGLFGFNFFFFLGMQFTTAVNAALIISLNPALTLLFSAFILKTPLKKQHIGGILLAFCGVLYLLSKGSLSNIANIQFSQGDILIFLANTVFALHHVWVKKYAVNISNRQFTFLTNVFCLFAVTLAMSFGTVGNPFSYPPVFWLASFGIGVLGTALAFFFWNSGVQKIGANHAGVFMNVVPLSAAILAVFFGENLSFYHLWSGLLILAGLGVMKGKRVRS